MHCQSIKAILKYEWLVTIQQFNSNKCSDLSMQSITFAERPLHDANWSFVIVPCYWAMVCTDQHTVIIDVGQMIHLRMNTFDRSINVAAERATISILWCAQSREPHMSVTFDLWLTLVNLIASNDHSMEDDLCAITHHQNICFKLIAFFGSTPSYRTCLIFILNRSIIKFSIGQV